MAINSNILRRPSDRGLFLAAAIAFPLLVLAGYFRSYYFGAFFGNTVPNSLVHFHGVVMTAWVLFFTVQIALVRTKNVRLHMTMGMVGVAHAALVVVVGFLTAYDSHIVRGTTAPGMHPYGFMLIALTDLIMFVGLFSAAVILRKRPREHKPLMLLTAINFMPAAVVRLPFIPQETIILWAYGIPDLIALTSLIWISIKHRKFNWIYAAAVLLLIVSHPVRIMLTGSQTWIDFVAWVVK
ncbi:MAG TPA: hypothetical protein VIL74_10100 [Pyrinomonadaceae bacterium]|jgi:hypothetical protein